MMKTLQTEHTSEIDQSHTMESTTIADDDLESGRSSVGGDKDERREMQRNYDENNPTTEEKKLEQREDHDGTWYMNKPLSLSVLIFTIGLCASSLILAFGVTTETNDQRHQFFAISSHVILELEAAINDYVQAAQWIHQAFRTTRTTGSQTFQDFAEVHDNLLSMGLEFEGVGYAMNVSADERIALEEESREYLAENYPDLNYRGFLQFGNKSLDPRENASFYFPAHFIAPMDRVAASTDVDIYTSPVRRHAVNEALKSFEPTLSAPVKVAHQIDSESRAALRSVILVHPGIPLPSSKSEVVPKDVAIGGVRVPSVMKRARKRISLREKEVSVYMFDTSKSSAGDDQSFFLGGAMLEAQHIWDSADGLKYEPEVELKSFMDCTNLYCHVEEYPVASRNWTFVVVATKDEFHPNVAFVILGATLIFLACTCTAFWVYIVYKRMARMNELQARVEAEKTVIQVESARKVEAEKAAILVESARESAAAERELNEFIAHEVRNPLSSAISAISFISCAVNETNPLVDDESRKSVKEDVNIVQNSLQFINDLLRNMLDMNRALTNRLSIDLAPVDILRDVLQPVVSMLYNRGSGFEVLLDCPTNIVVRSDRLRLKQTILNLGRNAAKFVETGFIRFRADIIDGSVRLCIEDSGPGIPVEKRGRLFARYQESLDLLNQGTGLGLSLCKVLIELMGGEIWLDESYNSGLGQQHPGARFVVDLKSPAITTELDNDNPVIDAAATGAVESSGTNNNNNNNLTIKNCLDPNASPEEEKLELPAGLSVLCVDDDLVLRKLFKRKIRKNTKDWQLSEAANGETALDLVQNQSFDMVFIDQYMTSTDRQLLGTETVRAMRSKGVRSIICGLSANDLEKTFLDVGANAFMMKPFPVDDKALVNELLRVIESGSWER